MKKISHSEYKVMQIIWSADHDLNRREIIDAVYADPNNTIASEYSISTYLNRLNEKAVLTKIKVGNKFIFKPLLTKTEYDQEYLKMKQFRINRDLNTFLGCDINELILKYLDYEITKENLEKVKAKLAEMTNRTL